MGKMKAKSGWNNVPVQESPPGRKVKSSSKKKKGGWPVSPYASVIDDHSWRGRVNWAKGALNLRLERELQGQWPPRDWVVSQLRYFLNSRNMLEAIMDWFLSASHEVLAALHILLQDAKLTEDLTFLVSLLHQFKTHGYIKDGDIPYVPPEAVKELNTLARLKGLDWIDTQLSLSVNKGKYDVVDRLIAASKETVAKKERKRGW